MAVGRDGGHPSSPRCRSHARYGRFGRRTSGLPGRRDHRPQIGQFGAYLAHRHRALLASPAVLRRPRRALRRRRASRVAPWLTLQRRAAQPLAREAAAAVAKRRVDVPPFLVRGRRGRGGRCSAASPRCGGSGCRPTTGAARRSEGQGGGAARDGGDGDKRRGMAVAPSGNESPMIIADAAAFGRTERLAHAVRAVLGRWYDSSSWSPTSWRSAGNGEMPYRRGLPWSRSSPPSAARLANQIGRGDPLSPTTGLPHCAGERRPFFGRPTGRRAIDAFAEPAARPGPRDRVPAGQGKESSRARKARGLRLHWRPRQTAPRPRRRRAGARGAGLRSARPPGTDIRTWPSLTANVGMKPS